MNAVAQVVVAVLLILVQVVLEVAEVLHLPVRLVLLVIRVRLEPLLEAVVQDQLIVVEAPRSYSPASNSNTRSSSYGTSRSSSRSYSPASSGGSSSRGSYSSGGSSSRSSSGGGSSRSSSARR